MAKRAPWDDYVPPVNIFGNLYFVGTHSASVHIIDTGEGLIMIDSGYPGNAMYVMHNLHELGLSPRRLKYILHTHGHYDHLGSTRAFLYLAREAKACLGEADLGYAEGKGKPSLAELFDASFTECFTPDILLQDGMQIALGNTVVTCVATPGHTEGTFSFFFDVSDGRSRLRAGMFGGAGLNSLSREFLKTNGLPLDMPEKYLASLARLESEAVDITLGNHVRNNQTEEKVARLLAGDKNAFIDPEEWKRFLADCRRELLAMLETEAKGSV